MGRASATAFYGAEKKLRTDTWQGVCVDIERRLACGDLADELCFLSFAGRTFTAETWEILERIFRQLRCTTLDLQRCRITDITPFINGLLPNIAATTKCFNLAGNALRTRSVRQLASAMAKECTQPSWLSIGEDAQKSSDRFIVDTKCFPFHRRGCLCTKALIVHVVPHLPKFDRAAKQRWQEKYLYSHEANTLQPSCTKFMAKVDDYHEWPALTRVAPPAPPPPSPTTTCEPTSSSFGDETESRDSESAVLDIPPLPDHREILIQWIEEERRARDSALARLISYYSGYCSARDGKLTSWTVGENALLLAVADDRRLHLVDCAQSFLRGEVVTVSGKTTHGLSPVVDFAFKARALPFSGSLEQHELYTIGGEALEIDKDSDDYIPQGYIAARIFETKPFLWFPIGYPDLAKNTFFRK